MESSGYWGARWADGKIGWHKSTFNSFLTKHISKINLCPPGRVFVPLCGKCLELLWFYDRGFEVVGIEMIEKPIQEFFEEYKLTYNVTQLSWAKLYETEDGRLKFFVCSLFDIDTENIGKFDIIWDRASLVAIQIEERNKYVNTMMNLCKNEFQYLLVTLQYNGIDCNGGPPRSIPDKLVEELFGDWCNIDHIGRTDASEERFRVNFGIEEIFETYLLLTPKS